MGESNSQKGSDTDILKIKDEGVITKRTTVSKQRENSDARSISVSTRKVIIPEFKVHEAGIVDKVEIIKKKPLDLNDALT